MHHINFRVNRMSSKGSRAASVLSTRSCFSSFEKWYRLLNCLDGIKGSTLVNTNHINCEICTEHCFLAPWVYLCSTSLTLFFKRNATFLNPFFPVTLGTGYKSYYYSIYCSQLLRNIFHDLSRLKFGTTVVMHVAMPIWYNFV